ncbi:Uncharacterised protein [Mycobacteroides abscessus]|nr:Uncharacterised protein [Mycobacteroides abscessus]
MTRGYSTCLDVKTLDGSPVVAARRKTRRREVEPWPREVEPWSCGPRTYQGDTSTGWGDPPSSTTGPGLYLDEPRLYLGGAGPSPAVRTCAGRP